MRGRSTYDFTSLERKIIINATPSRAHSSSPSPFPSPQPDAVFLFSHCCSKVSSEHPPRRRGDSSSCFPFSPWLRAGQGSLTEGPQGSVTPAPPRDWWVGGLTPSSPSAASQIIELLAPGQGWRCYVRDQGQRHAKGREWWGGRSCEESRKRDTQGMCVCLGMTMCGAICFVFLTVYWHQAGPEASEALLYLLLLLINVYLFFRESERVWEG